MALQAEIELWQNHVSTPDEKMGASCEAPIDQQS
jgi:hypothetical protein